VPNGHHQNEQLPIHDLAQDAAIPDPVAPESGEIRLQSLAEANLQQSAL
jgi:hypothetical protein